MMFALLPLAFQLILSLRVGAPATARFHQMPKSVEQTGTHSLLFARVSQTHRETIEQLVRIQENAEVTFVVSCPAFVFRNVRLSQPV